MALQMCVGMCVFSFTFLWNKAAADPVLTHQYNFHIIYHLSFTS